MFSTCPTIYFPPPVRWLTETLHPSAVAHILEPIVAHQSEKFPSPGLESGSLLGTLAKGLLHHMRSWTEHVKKREAQNDVSNTCPQPFLCSSLDLNSLFSTVLSMFACSEIGVAVFVKQLPRRRRSLRLLCHKVAHPVTNLLPYLFSVPCCPSDVVHIFQNRLGWSGKRRAADSSACSGRGKRKKLNS